MKLQTKFLGVLTVACMFAITSCNSDSTTSTDIDTATVKEDTVAAPADNGLNADQAAINFMVPDNEKEKAWLMAGLSNGSSKEVKDHAKMMLADHMKLGEKVSTLITSKNWSKPPVDTAGVVNLTEAKGKEWDKAWLNKMVADHSELLSKLNEAEGTVKDADLKTIITDTKPVVQHHLDMVKAAVGKMK